MSDNEYILAMYDIRGKQEFIYKKNKIKEIVGASYMIRECFADYLYPAAEECSESKKGLFNYKSDSAFSKPDSEFSREGFEKHLKEGYIGEVVYDGGGNFFVLYQNIEKYKEVNQRFYRKLLEGTYSLRVLTTYIEGVDFDDYHADQKKIYEKHRKNEQKESALHPVNALPFVQVDPRDSLPLSAKHKIVGKNQKVSYEKVSHESKRKYKKYEEIMLSGKEDKNIEGERLLDEMITKKGEESLLAVIYIDGNNMGAQVEKRLSEVKRPDGRTDTSYEASVKALREFSGYIQEHYVDNRIGDVDKKLQETSKQKRRFVVYAGDEVTFICNARNAYDIAVEYLEKLSKDEPKDAPRTSCAGIAIFHSHTPFSEAYRIAEECCESGKKLMKEKKLANVSLIDFHYCQGAIGTSLKEIRHHEDTENISRPWMVRGKDGIVDIEEKELSDGIVTRGTVKAMQDELKKAGRSNIKNLVFYAKKSEADFLSEIERIKAHHKDKIDFSLGLGEDLNNQEMRKLIFDMMIVYDLWFDNEKKGD